jgi:hypothetical protein
MKLFVPIVPEIRPHPNFQSVLVPERTPERELFEQWAQEFPDRDGKLIEEFQTTFNSTFWEIYLYACFREYGFELDWSHATPDFQIRSEHGVAAVEATTANAANGKPNEWDRTYSEEELKRLRRFRELNSGAIIRLPNAILGKVRKYESTYRKLDHVMGKPFVIAVAPFEQPHFNLQYDRPIKALLYNYYVDEDAFLENPHDFPDGRPPAIALDYVQKENGAEIPLGFFNDPNMAEVSAVIFSCTATWGKLSAMTKNSSLHRIATSIWAAAPEGAPPIVRRCDASEHVESICDGLQVYHNPYASIPLNPAMFRAPRVVQDYRNTATLEWIHEGRTDALLQRQVMSFMRSKN